MTYLRGTDKGEFIFRI